MIGTTMRSGMASFRPSASGLAAKARSRPPGRPGCRVQCARHLYARRRYVADGLVDHDVAGCKALGEGGADEVRVDLACDTRTPAAWRTARDAPSPLPPNPPARRRPGLERRIRPWPSTRPEVHEEAVAVALQAPGWLEKSTSAGWTGIDIDCGSPPGRGIVGMSLGSRAHRVIDQQAEIGLGRLAGMKPPWQGRSCGRLA